MHTYAYLLKCMPFSLPVHPLYVFTTYVVYMYTCIVSMYVLSLVPFLIRFYLKPSAYVTATE